MSDDSIPRLRRRPRDRAAFPTEFSGEHPVPTGVAPEIYAASQHLLTTIMARFTATRLRATYLSFDGDLTLALVLGEVAMRNVDSLFPLHASVARMIERLDATRDAPPKLRPCNALSIAEVTGIPRETVRRKLGKLLALGWIARTADDMYVITDRVNSVFPSFDDAQVADILAASDQVREVFSSVTAAAARR